MAHSKRPTVNTKCVAHHYAAPHERIVEFSAPNGQGGLIKLSYWADTGECTVDLYRLDDGVSVRVEPFPGGAPIERKRRVAA